MPYLVASDVPERSAGERFRELLARRGILRLPGAHNGMAALQAKRAGFEALYLSGAAMSASMGLPDLGIITVDDVAFFDWVRTIPLEVGRTYRFDRYFRADVNPVIIKVEKRETKEMPDGSKVPVLLLRPVVNEDGGMFHEKSKAKLWLTDDARRIPVEIRSNLRLVGDLTLQIRSYTPAPGGT